MTARCVRCGLRDGQVILELTGGGHYPLNADLFAGGYYWGKDVVRIAVNGNLCQRCRVQPGEDAHIPAGGERGQLRLGEGRA